MQNKENVHADHASEKKNDMDNANQRSSMGKDQHKENRGQQGGQKSHGQDPNQRSSYQKSGNWKTQDDEEIGTPGKHQEDDENNTEKKIPHMKNHSK